ncbi:hypothetical protein PM082_011073 [Marasmius tenuissimus]|nr:hypothetical protein PM082_011073 [Marasmius tenuissimus]
MAKYIPTRKLLSHYRQISHLSPHYILAHDTSRKTGSLIRPPDISPFTGNVSIHYTHHPLSRTPKASLHPSPNYLDIKKLMGLAFWLQVPGQDPPCLVALL